MHELPAEVGAFPPGRTDGALSRYRLEAMVLDALAVGVVRSFDEAGFKDNPGAGNSASEPEKPTAETADANRVYRPTADGSARYPRLRRRVR